MANDTGKVTRSFYLPCGLSEQLRDEAKAEDRSESAQLARILRERYDQGADAEPKGHAARGNA